MGDFAGKRVTVMGLGRFGGGVGVARWLASQGAKVLVTDAKPAKDLVEPLADIADHIEAGQIATRLGEHREGDFTDTDLVIANPAVPEPWANKYLAAASRAGVTIDTEIGLLVSRLPNRSRTLGVTGTVGKSTTTAMIAHALKNTGHHVALGGNIGVSLLPTLPIDPQTWVVLELSSFMLYWLGRTHKWSPAIAVVTNIGDNHTDWHGTFDHYVQSKQELIAYQRPGDVAILGQSVENWAPRTQARVISTGDQPLSPALITGPMALPGAHNLINANFALQACLAVDSSVTAERYAHAIAAFGGLPHRLQLVRELSRDGGEPLRFYNDSKSTTPQATLTAIDALERSGHTSRDRRHHIHLIAGGYDKHADLAPIGHLAGDIAGLYLIGATAPLIEATIDKPVPATSHVETATTLDIAVRNAVSRMKPGDVLLLSPGCASWGQYTNYEQRGDHFIALVNAVGNPAS